MLPSSRLSNSTWLHAFYTLFRKQMFSRPKHSAVLWPSLYPSQTAHQRQLWLQQQQQQSRLSSRFSYRWPLHDGGVPCSRVDSTVTAIPTEVDRATPEYRVHYFDNGIVIIAGMCILVERNQTWPTSKQGEWIMFSEPWSTWAISQMIRDLRDLTRTVITVICQRRL